MPDKQEVKEIDLLQLFSLIGNGIKNGFIKIIKMILFLIGFGIKRAHWLILIVILGGAIGYFFFSTTQRYYSSDLIAQPNGITAVDMVQYINDLNRFTKKGNSPALANALDLSDSLAKQIKNIEAFHYLDVNQDEKGDIIDFNHSYNPQDTTVTIDDKRIYVQVEVFNNNAFGSVKTGLFNYVAKNPYLIQLNGLRIRELKELVNLTEIEILKLDSLQNVNYFKDQSNLTTSNESKVMFLSEKEKQLFYRDKMFLTTRKQEYLKELEMATAPLTVIKDFTPLTMEENPRGQYIVIFGAFSFILGYIALLFLRYKENILKYVD